MIPMRTYRLRVNKSGDIQKLRYINLRCGSKPFNCTSGKIVGCGMADFDSQMQEGIIEWIQVLPEYRGKKIGQLLVNELLLRMKTMAKFATVSGQMNNPSSPEKLYRKCGFVGNDIWHILRSKK
ncbi:MAG: GNAT family N-acetyltransferase [Clostridia bacterium]|nr:GNAT family N-acetyltransferase [Clostridia bacterium]